MASPDPDPEKATPPPSANHGNGATAQGSINSDTNGHEQAPHHGMSIGQYVKTRFTTLKPTMRPAPNPIRLLRMITGRQWAFFGVAFFAWTWDAFDFFTVSLTVEELAQEFGKTNTDITWGITLVLMLRSVGAILFGIAADRYGRKWPFVVNNLLFIVLELGTAFSQTYPQFLACRALFGIAMGGLYGNAAATALEDLPPTTRGLMSGLLQQGYAFGYLLATAFARGLVNTTPHGWRPLFWFGACPPVLIIVWRLLLPETEVYELHASVRRTARAGGNGAGAGAAKEGVSATFLREGKVAMKKHWLILCYLVLLMAGFNFMSHGSQDLYPTMLRSQYGFGADAVTVTQVVANLGAMAGGIVVGFCSQIFGRRISIVVMCLLGGALLYPYTFVSSKAIIAAAFFEQFAVQGAWGVVPIHLMELSPGAFRTFVVGTSYQLGNLVSSASSTIESTIGERFPLDDERTDSGKVERYEYGKVICIFMGCVYAYVILLTLVGPEYLGRSFDVSEDEDVREVAGEEIVRGAVGERNQGRMCDGASGSGSDLRYGVRREHHEQTHNRVVGTYGRGQVESFFPSHVLYFWFPADLSTSRCIGFEKYKTGA
ncbi:major facilitator superfamily domain-containing protein [Sordaria brevicollis]|uniref:Major facilitator superfamily domain-containing protein n=1 Tax=Sordaria brevicollis TaxID=83679 RepID=A0AAE0UDD0_SORBR|nr:major facilitator superfamily domain-containing protein [Sordaria brevicollis]